MKLLIVTQAVDRNHPVLGFFHEWIRALATHYERVEVVCLFEGEHALPANVRVHSLGKEKGDKSRGAYALRFLSLAWTLRHTYDAVFAHMNQEYLLIAGWLWRLLGKRAYLWRNHWAGSILTDIAAAFAEKVFCTSRHSYTVKYEKTRIMPVGVDLERFSAGEASARRPRSVLFLARMAPAKHPELLIEALSILKGKGVDVKATFVGSPAKGDEGFYEGVKERAFRDAPGMAEFHEGVPHDETPTFFREHDVFVNASGSGMFDKTLFEAAASGALVLATSDDWKREAGDAYHFETAAELAEKLERFFTLSAPERENLQVPLGRLAESNALRTLVPKLVEAIV
jgi:glycosyltransferase involved in cell wall biosynthesis